MNNKNEQEFGENSGGNLKPDRTARSYWRANLKLVAICLLIWFLVSYVCGILLVEPLNQFRLFGYKLGFWFAQQGSIYVFLILIFWYAWRMNRLDREYGAREEDGEEDGEDDGENAGEYVGKDAGEQAD